MDKINVNEKLSLIKKFWAPKVVGEINDVLVRVAKFKGEFVWHKHDNEDEMFFVIKGKLLIKFRDRDVSLNAGEFIVVPKGVEHLPIATEEAHVMLIEPSGTVRTGNI
jgi:mannose-6-phosphate isomerase-like protein (cupin superfamily)